MAPCCQRSRLSLGTFWFHLLRESGRSKFALNCSTVEIAAVIATVAATAFAAGAEYVATAIVEFSVAAAATACSS